MGPPAAEAVIVTGVYGAGKSTVVADLAALLGSRGRRYGVIDVDWLGWFDAGGDEAAYDQVLLANVAAVCRAYRDAGVELLALAYAVGDRARLEGLRAAIGVPLKVVRLEVDAATVRHRLAVDPTEERSGDDLRVALGWLATGRGAGLEDLSLPGDRPVRLTSEAICEWLGWA